jgi:uncharacterized protein YbbK (DUF523 family)
MKKIALSACLLGEWCRYDGKIKRDDAIMNLLHEYEVVSFCPEAPLFGTPRERINLLHVKGHTRAITADTNIDVTDKLINKTMEFISLNPDLEMIVLKSKSPSCGIATTPLLDKDRKPIKLCDGISTSTLKSAYPNIPLYDENSFLQQFTGAQKASLMPSD